MRILQVYVINCTHLTSLCTTNTIYSLRNLLLFKWSWQNKKIFFPSVFWIYMTRIWQMRLKMTERRCWYLPISFWQLLHVACVMLLIMCLVATYSFDLKLVYICQFTGKDYNVPRLVLAILLPTIAALVLINILVWLCFWRRMERLRSGATQPCMPCKIFQGEFETN